ncbi:MAG: hypothetical protein M3Q97_11980, partial [Bacteroidota bacterium]|nr:hypothetical protein [Bacteroidota bacterium]
MKFSNIRIAPEGRKDWLKYLLLLATILLIAFIIPKQGKFRYSFEPNKRWLHEDLVAPFQFAIEKSEAELELERNEIKRNFKPFYVRQRNVTNDQKDKFIATATDAMKENGIDMGMRKHYISTGLRMLGDMYDRGVIEVDSAHKDKPGQFIIIELTNKMVKDRLLSEYYRPNEAKRFLLERAQQDSALNLSWFILSLQSSVAPNIK